MQLTNASGTAIITYKYDAFGNHMNAFEHDDNPYRYCGEYWDDETETYYLRARHYRPSTGRFTQRDTYGGSYTDTLSLNRYTYGHNNPLKYRDPSGHAPQLTQWEKDNLTKPQQDDIMAQKVIGKTQAGFTGGTDGATYTIIQSNTTYVNTGVTNSLTTKSGTTGTTINNSGTINTVTVQKGSSTSITNTGSIGTINNSGTIGTVNNNGRFGVV